MGYNNKNKWNNRRQPKERTLGQGIMVEVRNNDVNKALRIFKKKVQGEAPRGRRERPLSGSGSARFHEMRQHRHHCQVQLSELSSNCKYSFPRNYTVTV